MIQRIIELFGDISLYGLEKIGLYYSSYRGFIADNNDPWGLNRVKVSVPDVYGEHIPEVWAWPLNNYSGKGYGIQVIPRKNDLVWVSFERGNPKKPLWNHGYFGKNEKPSELNSPNKYWIRTPKGLTILMDDDAETITQYNKSESSKIEPMILGNTLQDKLNTLLDILKEGKINTAIGPQPFLPDTLSKLENLQNSLDEIKSITNKLS